MRVVDQGFVFAGRPKTDAASATFPSVCVLESGRWVAGFRLAPAKLARAQRAFASWSDDQGRTWSPPTEPAASSFADAARAGRPGSWRAAALASLGGPRVAAVLGWEDASNPLVPMFNEQTEGVVDMKLFVAFSEDGGARFSTPRRIACGRFDAASTPITGPMMTMPDGRWAVPFEVNKQYDDPAPWQHSSCITFSTDRGESWNDVVEVHTDPLRRIFCWDQRLTVLPDGDVLVLFWTFDRVANAYLNIHSRRSRDSGRTWGDLTDTGVPGQPARPVGLPDGRIAMVYVDRTAAPCIKARVSKDGGETWPAETEVLVHERSAREQSQTWDKRSMQDAWAEMSAFSVGLPDAVALPGGDVLAVFYSGDSPNLTDVLWARIKP